MDSLHSAPNNSIQAPNGHPGNTPSTQNQSLLNTAGSVDNCMDEFMSMFNEAFTATESLEADNANLQLGMDKQILGEQKEQSGMIKETEGSAIQDEGRIERSAAIKEAFLAENANDKAHITEVKDGKLVFTPVAGKSKAELEKATAENRIAFKHEKILALSPQLCATLGYHDGQKIKYKDDEGVVHDLIVHQLDASEMTLLSKVFTQLISTMPSDRQNKDEKDTKLEKHEKKTHLSHTETTPLHKKNTKRITNEKIRENQNERPFSKIGHKEIEKIEEKGIENSRNRQRDAHNLSVIITKLNHIILSDENKIDAQNQNLKLDNLKTEHTLAPIPRSTLVK